MNMKIYFLCLVFALSFNSPVFSSEDQILNSGRALQFGLWKVYNSGKHIYFIDKDADHIVVIVNFDQPRFYTQEKTYRITSNSGRTSIISPAVLDQDDERALKRSLKTEEDGQLKDGRFRFGDNRFVVNGDTISIFPKLAENARGEISFGTVLNKFSNGMVFNGTEFLTSAEPTVRLNANDIPTPAKILGDCLATYSPETGRVEIPCLKIKGRTTIYHVEQHQVPNTFTFDVNESDVTPVQ